MALACLRAMAEAVPRALISSGLSGNGRPSARPVHALQQLRAQHQLHGPSCRAGIVTRTLDSQLDTLHAVLGSKPSTSECVVSELGDIAITDALQCGICHTFEGTMHRWSSAVTMLIQLLSIDHVLPACQRDSTGASAERDDSSDDCSSSSEESDST